MRNSGSRPRREARKLKTPPSKALPKHLVHPRFGKIPLVEVQVTLGNDRQVSLQIWDPTHPLPAGVLHADIRKQTYGLGGPRHFYEDQERRCLQCDLPFVFTAKEQRYWYESLGFYLDAQAVRCLACRRRKRNALALERQVAAARAELRESSKDPLAHLALAQTLLRLHELTGAGRLGDGLAAARKAARLGLVEGRFYEGAAQEALARPDKAAPAYEAFVAEAADLQRCRRLLSQARARLAELA